MRDGAGFLPAITCAAPRGDAREREAFTMATYECSKCGMAVNTICAKCNTPLVDASLQRPDGSSVQIAKCPDCEGKIKSPLCCGQDMSCAI